MPEGMLTTHNAVLEEVEAEAVRETVAGVAEAAGISEQTVRDSLAALEDANMERAPCGSCSEGDDGSARDA